MIEIKLNEDEASYLKSILQNETLKAQMAIRKRPELSSFFGSSNKMNGSISRKISQSINRKKCNYQK